MQLSSQDYTNIVIALIGIGYYIFKQFIEPNLPASKAARVNNDLATLTQAAALAVQKVEQLSSNRDPDTRKRLATQDIKTRLGELGAPIPSDEAISGAIESAVYLLRLAQGKSVALPDRATRQTPTIRDYYHNDMPPK
jgi:hypothetical protein